MIPVFTTYDQFRLDVKMKSVDRGGDPALLSAEVEENFRKQYYYCLNLFKELPPFERLEREIESAHRGVDSARAELILASGNPAIYIHNDIPTAASRKIFSCVQDDFRGVQKASSSSSANVSSSTGDIITGNEGTAGPSSLASDLEAGSDEGACCAPLPVIPFRSLTGGWYHVKSPQRWWTPRHFDCLRAGS
jgi:hypothetical protein